MPITRRNQVRVPEEWRDPPRAAPKDLRHEATTEIAAALNRILDDVFSLHVRTRNFRRHAIGRRFRDDQIRIDRQANQPYAMPDPVAEGVRKIGGITVHMIGQIGRLQRVLDNDADFVTPVAMLAELRDDNKMLAAALCETLDLSRDHRDAVTASVIEIWIDETERRMWFLLEAAGRNTRTIN